ncbi:unnamed protein product [Urochloa humidicola]
MQVREVGNGKRALGLPRVNCRALQAPEVVGNCGWKVFPTGYNSEGIGAGGAARLMMIRSSSRIRGHKSSDRIEIRINGRNGTWAAAVGRQGFAATQVALAGGIVDRPG